MNPGVTHVIKTRGTELAANFEVIQIIRLDVTLSPDTLGATAH